MSAQRIGVLGTGMVGRALGGKLVAVGHEVMMGSRTAGNKTAIEWAAAAGPRASEGTFADAAAFGQLVVNATAGVRSLDALATTRPPDLAGKVLLDVANPLDHSAQTTTLTIANTDSLGERIQREHPDARVVKALNTMNADVMVDPGLVAGSHDVFVCGDDPSAKATVVELLCSFGWPPQDVVDLGDITAARGTEAYLLLWLRLGQAKGTGHLNLHVKAEGTGQAPSRTAVGFVLALEAGDFAALEAMGTDDFTFTGLSPEPLDMDGFLTLQRGFHQAMSEVHFTPEVVSEDGEEVELRIVLTARQTGEFAGQPPTGRTLVLPEQRPVYRIRDGRVASVVMPAVEGAGIDNILAQLRAD